MYAIRTPESLDQFEPLSKFQGSKLDDLVQLEQILLEDVPGKL